MEVGIVTWTYPPEKSGLAVAAHEIAHALAEAGQRVRVISFDRSGRSADGAVEVIGAAATGIARRLRRIAGVGHLAGPWAIARVVAAEHRRRRFDVLEGTNWFAPLLLVGGRNGPPCVTRNSTPVAITGRGARGGRDRLDHGIACALEAWSARRSTGLISNTAAHGAMIAELYCVPPPGRRHLVVGLSVEAATAAAGAVADYPAAGPVRLLFIGRAERRKGYDALLDAFARLAAEAEARTIPDFVLTIVGVAGSDIDLPPAAATRLTAYHRLEIDDLRRELAAAHVVVAPSRYESFGLVYQEAMAFGRPVVACAEDASARLFVGNSGAGTLAERCDGDALAAAIRPLIVDPQQREAYHRASRAAGGRFTRAGLAEATLAAYAAALSR